MILTPSSVQQNCLRLTAFQKYSDRTAFRNGTMLFVLFLLSVHCRSNTDLVWALSALSRENTVTGFLFPDLFVFCANEHFKVWRVLCRIRLDASCTLSGLLRW